MLFTKKVLNKDDDDFDNDGDDEPNCLNLDAPENRDS